MNSTIELTDIPIINHTISNQTIINDSSKYGILSIILLVFLSIALFLISVASFHILITIIKDNCMTKTKTINNSDIEFDIEKNINKNITINKESICCICLENNDDKSVSILCNHVFHHNCIKKWVEYSIRENNIMLCPICKEKIIS